MKKGKANWHSITPSLTLAFYEIFFFFLGIGEQKSWKEEDTFYFVLFVKKWAYLHRRNNMSGK